MGSGFLRLGAYFGYGFYIAFAAYPQYGGIGHLEDIYTQWTVGSSVNGEQKKRKNV